MQKYIGDKLRKLVRGRPRVRGDQQHAESLRNSDKKLIN